MPRYLYEAKKSPQQKTTGVIVASNTQQALQQIASLGLFVISMKEDTEKVSQPAYRDPKSKVSSKELALFTRQMADLVESGIPLVRALEIREKQAKSETLRKAISEIRLACTSGDSFSDALRAQPRIFPRLYSIVIKAGEISGALDHSLRRLSAHWDRHVRVQGQMQTALAYPAFMLVAGLATFCVMMVFVVPKLMGIFEDLGQALPWPTRVIIFLSQAFTDHLVWTILFLTVGAILWNQWYQTSSGKRQMDMFRWKIPLIGRLFQKNEIARFVYTLATLIQSGVTILEALAAASETVSHPILKEDLVRSIEKVRNGSQVSSALSDCQMIPEDVIQMIAIGEEAGRLDKSLIKISETYDRDADETTKILLSIMEPVLILSLGLVFGFLVIAILLPIFEMSSLTR